MEQGFSMLVTCGFILPSKQLSSLLQLFFPGPNRSLAAHPEVGLNRFSTAVAVGPLVLAEGVFVGCFLAKRPKRRMPVHNIMVALYPRVKNLECCLGD